MQRVELALVGAIKANHTTRIVDPAVFNIDRPTLTVLLTEATVLTFVFVELDAKYRESREETEDGAHGTNRVAISSAVEECQDPKDEHHHPGNDAEGHVAHVETGDDTAVVAVRLQEGGYWCEADDKADDEDGTNGVT